MRTRKEIWEALSGVDVPAIDEKTGQPLGYGFVSPMTPPDHLILEVLLDIRDLLVDLKARIDPSPEAERARHQEDFKRTAEQLSRLSQAGAQVMYTSSQSIELDPTDTPPRLGVEE